MLSLVAGPILDRPPATMLRERTASRHDPTVPPPNRYSG